MAGGVLLAPLLLAAQVLFCYVELVLEIRKLILSLAAFRPQVGVALHLSLKLGCLLTKLLLIQVVLLVQVGNLALYGLG